MNTLTEKPPKRRRLEKSRNWFAAMQRAVDEAPEPGNPPPLQPIDTSLFKPEQLIAKMIARERPYKRR